MRSNCLLILVMIVCLAGCGPLLLADKPEDVQVKPTVYIATPLFFTTNLKFRELLAQKLCVAHDPGDANYLLYLGQAGNHVMISIIDREGQMIISDNEIVIAGNEQAIMRLVISHISHILNCSSDKIISTNNEVSI